MAEQWITPYEVRDALREAIVRQARFAADFQCSAENVDRPIAETPHLAPYRYGNGAYDARWYSVHGSLDGFTSGLDGAIEDALHRLERTAYAMGLNAHEVKS